VSEPVDPGARGVRLELGESTIWAPHAVRVVRARSNARVMFFMPQLYGVSTGTCPETDVRFV
jgi:hypothetical protein